MANWKRRLWKWTAGTFAALVTLLAAVAGLFRLLTPLVPGYRAEVEQWASDALQHPVEIHSMSAEWGWHGPEVALEGVRILSRDKQRVVVAAQEVRLGLALSSLLHGQLPRPDRVVLVAPRIEVERDAQGVYDVRGLEGGAQKNNTDWRSTLQEVFAQRAELSVKGGQVTLFDARHTGSSVFQRIDISVDNNTDEHSIKGSAQLPSDFGRSIKFDLSIQGQGLEPAAWDWHAGLTVTGLQVQRWLSYGPAAYQDFMTGGNLDLDAKLASKQGELLTAALDISGHDLMRAAVPGPALGALQGKFDWRRTTDGWHLEGRKLGLHYGDSAWPVDDLDLEYAVGPDGERWSGDAGFLRLQDLSRLAAWMPASAGSPTDMDLTRLRAFSPSGDLSTLRFKARWDGKALQDWVVKAGFQDLGVHAAEGWPGFAGMDGSLDLATTGGQVRLAARNADVDFRPLFRNMLHADTADLDVSVDHDPKGWRFAADSFQLANADAAAHGRVAMAFPADDSAPVLDLDANVDRADAHNKSLYFPVGIMEKPLVKWLDDSIKGGQVVSGSVAIHGKTSDFPYRDNKGGTFDIQFHVQHAELDYMAGWPALKDLDADVRFLDQGLSAKLKSGSFQGDALTGGTASFADLETGILEIDGTARGSAANGLDFLRQGPLKEVLAGYLDGIAAKGDTDVGLHLHLPVTDVEAFKLQGKVTLHQVSIGPMALPALTAEHLEGVLDFGNYGFATSDVHGTLLGGPVDIAIRTPHTDHGNASSLSAHGIAEAQGLVPLLGHDAEHWLDGQTAWQVDGKLPLQAGVGVTGLNLTLRSDLSGLAVKLPAPFSKDVAAALPLRVVMKFENEDDLGFTGGYGDVLGLRLDFAPSQGKLGFERGELRIGAGTAARPSAPGLEVNGVLPAFVWDEWKPMLTSSSVGEAQIAATRGSSGTPSPMRAMDLDVGRVVAFGQTVPQLHIDLAPAGDGWQGRVDSALLAGTFNVPAKVDAAHPILLDMDRADFGKPGLPAAKEVAKQAQSAGATEFHYDPRDIPALRLTSKHLQYGDMVLDNVGLALVPQSDGVALEDLKVAAPSFNITGDGTWSVTPAGQQHTTLNADVESTDVEKSLQALGYDPGITGDKGSIVAALNWQDSPLGDVTSTLAGSIHVKLTDGQLKEVQPGAGRVFGLLSLNALPRRILLNFSDVFAKGFGYDSIEGDFTLQDGDAYTQNLLMKGPAASIHLVGRTGLAKHDFDEALIVDASVGSTLPVVGALAAGVGVGAVVFLLTEIFKKPLAKAGEVRYHLTGTWDNPTLTKLPDTVPAAATRKPN